MSSKWQFRLAVVLFILVMGAALYLPSLRRQVNKAKDITEKTAAEARRELLPLAPLNSGDPMVKAKMFWGSRGQDGTLVPVAIELPLSPDPVVRAKQILNTLLAGPIDPEARTLPSDALLLEFYIMPDGTAVADFSEGLANGIPSGIQSEQLAVDSITRTLQANVPQVQRLKILIHGQEVDTLAGHLDLTQTFQVSMKEAEVTGPTGIGVIAAPIQKAIEKVTGGKKK